MKYRLLHNLRYFGKRGGVLMIIGGLIYLVYFFYQPSVELNGRVIENPLYEFVEKFEWWLYLLVYSIIISFLNSLLFIGLSFYYNYKRDKQRVQRTFYEKLFSEKVIGYVYSGYRHDMVTENEFIGFFKEKTQSHHSRVVLLSVISRMQESITDDLQVRFRHLIDVLNITPIIPHLLFSRNLSEQIIALKIISHLKLDEHHEKIKLFLNSKKDMLRTEAIAALIRLTETKKLGQLLLQQRFISQLDLNIIVNEIERSHKGEIDYPVFLQSPSPRVTAIGVMLMKRRGKAQYLNLIKPFLNADDDLLKEITWNVFAALVNNKEDMKLMISKFNEENFDNKMALLRAVKRLKIEDIDFGFLDSVIKKEHLLLKVYALKILFDKNIEKLHEYRDVLDENVRFAYKEVVDMNIN